MDQPRVRSGALNMRCFGGGKVRSIVPRRRALQNPCRELALLPCSTTGAVALGFVTSLEKDLQAFAQFVAELKGDEKSEAQTFLFHLFEAFGHDANTLPEGCTFE